MDVMDKAKFYAGVAVAAALVFLGLMIPCGVKTYRSFDRTVSVKGLCEREVLADKVIWPIQYKAVGNDLSAVYKDLEAKNALVQGFLAKGGIAAEEISVSAPSLSDKLTQEYGHNDRAFRFVAKGVVTVCTKDVDKVLALVSDQSELIKNGIAPENEWDSQPSFTFESLNGIKPEMIEEATKNAREVAVKFAKDSGSSLGKIKTASQGTFSIEDRDSNTPHIKKVRVVTGITYYLSR